MSAPAWAVPSGLAPVAPGPAAPSPPSAAPCTPPAHPRPAPPALGVASISGLEGPERGGGTPQGGVGTPRSGVPTRPRLAAHPSPARIRPPPTVHPSLARAAQIGAGSGGEAGPGLLELRDLFRLAPDHRPGQLPGTGLA